jgi:hypothetical protein
MTSKTTTSDVNKCTNFILWKLNYKFSSAVYEHSIQCHQEISEVLSVDASILGSDVVTG